MKRDVFDFQSSNEHDKCMITPNTNASVAARLVDTKLLAIMYKNMTY